MGRVYRNLKYEEAYLRSIDLGCDEDGNKLYLNSQPYYTLSLKKYKVWRRHIDKQWKLESRRILNNLSKDHKKSIQYENLGNFVKPRSFNRYSYKK